MDSLAWADMESDLQKQNVDWVPPKEKKKT